MRTNLDSRAATIGAAGHVLDPVRVNALLGSDFVAYRGSHHRLKAALADVFAQGIIHQRLSFTARLIHQARKEVENVVVEPNRNASLSWRFWN